MDDMAQQFAQFFSSIPFNRILGLKLAQVEHDEVIVHFAMQETLVGNFLYGILHGGVIAAVLDMAGGAAAMVAFVKKENQPLEEVKSYLSKTSTIHLHIDYLRPGKGNQFAAKAKVLRAGKKIIVTRIELFNDTQTLIASASGTYLIG